MSVRARDVLKSVLKAHSQSPTNKKIVLSDADLAVYSGIIEAIGEMRGAKNVVFLDGENFLNNGTKTFVDLFERFPQRNILVFVKWTLNNRDPRRYNDITESQRKSIVNVCSNSASVCDAEIDDILILACALYDTRRHGRNVVILSNDKYKFLGNDPSLKVNLQGYEIEAAVQGTAVQGTAVQGTAVRGTEAQGTAAQGTATQEASWTSRESAGLAFMLATPVFAMVIVLAALLN